jgi:hypothetical protein
LRGGLSNFRGYPRHIREIRVRFWFLPLLFGFTSPDDPR